MSNVLSLKILCVCCHHKCWSQTLPKQDRPNIYVIMKKCALLVIAIVLWELMHLCIMCNSHCGNNGEGTLFLWLFIYIYNIYIYIYIYIYVYIYILNMLHILHICIYIYIYIYLYIRLTLVSIHMPTKGSLGQQNFFQILPI